MSPRTRGVRSDASRRRRSDINAITRPMGDLKDIDPARDAGRGHDLGVGRGTPPKGKKVPKPVARGATLRTGR